MLLALVASGHARVAQAEPAPSRDVPDVSTVDVAIEGPAAEADALALALAEPLARIGVIPRRAIGGAPPPARGAGAATVWIRLDVIGASLTVRDARGALVAEREFDASSNRDVLHEELAHALQSILEAMLLRSRDAPAARPPRGSGGRARSPARRAPASAGAEWRAGASVGVGWVASGRGAGWGAGLTAELRLAPAWWARLEALRWSDVESQPAGVAVDLRQWSLRASATARLVGGRGWEASAALGPAIWVTQPEVRPSPGLEPGDTSLQPAATLGLGVEGAAELGAGLSLLVSPLVEWAPAAASFFIEDGAERRVAFRRRPLAGVITLSVVAGRATHRRGETP